jgi:hypothetical protein
MKKFFIISFLLFTAILAHAQKKEKKIQFTSLTGISFISGENSNNFGLQTVNGLRFKKSWIIGLGVAYDAYQVPSVPVFLELRKYLGHKNFTPFIYADAGRNITLPNSKYPSGNVFESYHFTPANYVEAGIGISRSLTKKTKFFLSAGYSSKQFNYDMTSKFIYYYPPWGSSIFHYNYTFQRLAIKLGIEL